MIESERTLYEPAPNGQDKLATYRADSAGAVDLDWWDPSAGEIDWSIRRDGVPVANVNGSSFTDRRTQVSAKATYVIEGEWSTTGESYLTQIDVPAIDTSAVGLPSTDRSLSAASNTDVLSQVASALRAVQLEVNTFIPSAEAGLIGTWTPCLEQSIGHSPEGPWYYGGDNRGFTTADQPSVRTAVRVEHVFDGPLYGWSNWSTRTSGTKLWYFDGRLAASAQADLSNIVHSGDFGDPYSRGMRFDHAVKDPLWSIAFNIDYQIFFKATRTTYGFVGWHDKAPSFEFRARAGASSPWALVYMFDNQGLFYLAGITPKQNVDISGPL